MSREPSLSELLIPLGSEIEQGTRSRGYRAASRGELHRITPGQWALAERASRLSDNDRFRLLIEASRSRLRADDVLSHWSAALLWQLPIIGSWPDRVDVTVHQGSHLRSTTVLRRHVRPLVEKPHRLWNFPITTVAETVVDIARVAPFATAVAMGDAALRRHEHSGNSAALAGVSRPQLERVCGGDGERRGLARARRVLDFIDGRADRPGESLSRVTMHLLGVPAPILQHRLVTPLGKIYYLDFYWPEFNIGGDFDGRIKYTDPAFRGGRSVEEVVYDEKLREDDVRLMVDGYGRWDYTVAGSPQLLAARLRRIGLRW